jgi:dihydroorotate dehydrogenase electron transfer subunit
MNYPRITPIIEIKNENANVKTIFFDYPEKIIPGQFFMIWIPGVDEIPMSVSYIGNNYNAFTFRNVGNATEKLFNYKIGDKIGIRGPYGNGFLIKNKKIIFIGGGTGIATLAPAIEFAVKKNINLKVIIGVKNKNELFFENRLKKIVKKIYISTNDGSIGYNGNASDLAKKILINEKDFSIITCGPEIMMKKLYDLYGYLPFQASLERYIKCAVGLCGQCCIGDGLRVCLDGPVFESAILKNIKDFGLYKRNESGNIEYF